MAVIGEQAKKPDKPSVLKIVRTEGGYAVYLMQASMHPTAVSKSRWEILDMVAEWLARQEEGKP